MKGFLAEIALNTIHILPHLSLDDRTTHSSVAQQKCTIDKLQHQHNQLIMPAFERSVVESASGRL